MVRCARWQPAGARCGRKLRKIAPAGLNSNCNWYEQVFCLFVVVNGIILCVCSFVLSIVNCFVIFLKVFSLFQMIGRFIF